MKGVVTFAALIATALLGAAPVTIAQSWTKITILVADAPLGPPHSGPRLTA